MTAIQNIRRRRLEKERRMHVPEEPCRKCGDYAWDKDMEPGTWYCFTCGNLAYFNGTGCTQQCDMLCSTQQA